MELARSITLNEEALTQIAEQKRPIFILEWLRYLDKFLGKAQKSDVKECQKKLVDQLLRQIQNSPGPASRRYLGRCMATLFSVGDPFLLFDAVNKCNDILKNKDDSPSFLPTKLAAITCIGTMYERLGRLMGRSYEETMYLLLKCLKSAESQSRCEIYLTLERIIAGMGNAAGSVHRDVFKALRHGITDRVMPVRCAAAGCLREMIRHAMFLYTTDLESVFSLCFRALDASNYDVRCSVAHVLGFLVATTQQTSPQSVGKNRLATLDEVLNLLASGFLRGGIGFLKSGPTEMIKGGSTASREVKVGVTHAYVSLVSYLGSAWLEKNMSVFVTHLLDLLANPKSAASHMDAVHSRKCVSFILSSSLGKQLGEKAQCQAIKELINVINRYGNSGGAGSEAEVAAKEGADTQLVQHVLICSLSEIGSLIERLGTCSASVVNDPALGVIDTVVSVLTHSMPSARLAAAWCLRCISVASPSQLTPLIERSLERLETMKSSPETIYGSSAALAALLGATCQTPLGIPHSKGKLIFNIAEDLLRSASQNSRLSLQRTQAGWLLIGAVMTLGPPVVRGLLPRMLLLWKNSFPRSSKELESEKARGDAFTWQVTLENRAGALSAMACFLTQCKKIVNEEVVRRLLTPIESAVNMLTALSSIFKNFGPAVKAASAMVRLRLYETLLLLPPECYESTYTSLLRLLVAEFTLAENGANTTTTILRSLCHADDDIILGSWLQDTDQRLIEDQLQPNCSTGCGALEHDITTLYKVPDRDSSGPFPLGVAVIDKSCLVFAHVFRFVASKHRLQMITHFSECIKHAKSVRQEAVQLNILSALLGSLKSLSESKASLGSQEMKNATITLLLSMLPHGNAVIRCAAAQALGRCGHVVDDARAVAEIAQVCFDKVKTARDAQARTGHSFALGCLHRHVGSLGSSQHLNTSISILLALSQDSASPVVQVWALHSLTLIADSGGPMFRSYVEPCLNQSLRLLMNVPQTYSDVHQCIGKLLAALITAVGPELQANTNTVCATRSTVLVSCAVMQEHSDPLVQAEAIGCLQQLHMFAPQHVNLRLLVPTLCNVLSNEHLFLRRASISCLHQLSQREAREVCEHASNWIREKKSEQSSSAGIPLLQGDHGLPGVLFSMLDRETDVRITRDIKKIVTSLTQALATDYLHKWLALCKEVLTAAESNSVASSPEKETEDGDVDDDVQFKAGDEKPTHPAIPPKWSTKVYGAETLCRIIVACENAPNSDAQFDLSLARQRKAISGGTEDFLVLHLSDIIRMTFMAATSDSDPLRLEGLRALQLVIDCFAKVPEPEFPNHVILEQYQAQVGAALRPAFSHETPSHVTAMACQVCSTWIGSGVARDLNDLRRVHQLLVSSLTKLQKDSSSRHYNESASTLEKLAILKAWAEVYAVAMNQKESETNHSKQDNQEDEDVQENIGANESLLHLVSPELVSLSTHWLAALKDHAHLTLPADFSSQLPHDGGAFYTSETIDVARSRYRESWPQILQAAALWLCSNNFSATGRGGTEEGANETDEFYLLFGICMEALCNPKSTDPLSYVLICLKSLRTLFEHSLPSTIIGSDKLLAVEMCNVLHRLLLTRDTPACQLLVLDIAQLIVDARFKSLDEERKQFLKELTPANQKPEDEDSLTALSALGEGGEEGNIVPGQSVAYAILEVCLCVLVRQLPELSPGLASAPGLASSPQKRSDFFISEESAALTSSALILLCKLQEICSPKGSLVILPSVLYLLTGVLKETAVRSQENLSDTKPVSTVLQCLRSLCASSRTRNPICGQRWVELLQSTLAKILDFSKTSDDEPKPDQVTTVLAIGVFITTAPPKVVKLPNLQFPCINLLRQSLQSENEIVQIKCLQTLRAIFERSSKSVSVPYIHALAPRVVELFGQHAAQIAVDNISKNKHDGIMEALAVLETLIEIVEQNKKLDLLGLYIPILISLLTENLETIRGKSFRKQIHNYALQKLVAIGPIHPQEFRQIIGQVPTYRTKLETAIRNQQNVQQLSNGTVSQNRAQPTRNDAPVIKLKTDFSHYTGGS